VEVKPVVRRWSPNVNGRGAAARRQQAPKRCGWHRKWGSPARRPRSRRAGQPDRSEIADRRQAFTQVEAD